LVRQGGISMPRTGRLLILCTIDVSLSLGRSSDEGWSDVMPLQGFLMFPSDLVHKHSRAEVKIAD
jgi:hypothetical protein